jgi:colicin import membrane protein
MDMKKLMIVAVLMLASTAIQAQEGQWVRPQDNTQQQQQTKKKRTLKEMATDPKYLTGAVPEVDGKVVFTHSYTAPGKSAKEIYDLMYKKLQVMAQAENQITSQVAIVNETTLEIGASFVEWMVFKKTSLVLDRTRFYYTVHVHCTDGKADVTISRLRYLYDEERTPTRYTAEEWISDREALNKKKTKLLPVSDKFRRMTVDRMEAVFNELATALQ